MITILAAFLPILAFCVLLALEVDREHEKMLKPVHERQARIERRIEGMEHRVWNLELETERLMDELLGERVK